MDKINSKQETKITEWDQGLGLWGLSHRTTQCLKRADIYTIGQLLRTNEITLTNIKNFGHKSLTEVQKTLKDYAAHERRFDLALNGNEEESPFSDETFFAFSSTTKALLENEKIDSFKSLIDLAKFKDFAHPNVELKPRIELLEFFNACNLDLMANSLKFSVSDIPVLRDYGMPTEKIASNCLNTFPGGRGRMKEQTVDKVKEYLRIFDGAKEGKTLVEIGKEVGLTRERVRQILEKYFKDVADSRIEVKGAIYTKRKIDEIRQELSNKLPNTSGNISINQITSNLKHTRLIGATSKHFDINPELVKEIYEALCDQDFIVGDQHVNWGQAKQNVNHTDEELKSYLEITYRQTSRPVTPRDYMLIRHQNLTEKQWPTGQTITLRWPSWNDACQAAGVPCGVKETKRKYSKIWPKEKLEKALDEFAIYCKRNEVKPTVRAYEAWRSIDGIKAPSLAIARRSAGTWLESITNAFHRTQENTSLSH